MTSRGRWGIDFRETRGSRDKNAHRIYLPLKVVRFDEYFPTPSRPNFGQFLEAGAINPGNPRRLMLDSDAMRSGTQRQRCVCNCRHFSPLSSIVFGCLQLRSLVFHSRQLCSIFLNCPELSSILPNCLQLFLISEFCPTVWNWFRESPISKFPPTVLNCI